MPRALERPAAPQCEVQGGVMGVTQQSKVLPFLAGDVIKAVAAALLLPGAWKLAGRN